jgi:hypothetical protein
VVDAWGRGGDRGLGEAGERRRGLQDGDLKGVCALVSFVGMEEGVLG